jgi:hypothetical protein
VSGFPGPPSYAEVEAAQRRLELEQARSDSHYDAPARSPDSDDFCDALYLRARVTRAGDRRTADMLELAADRIRELEAMCSRSTVQRGNQGEQP